MRRILLAAAVPLLSFAMTKPASAGAITQTITGLSQTLGDFTPFDITALPFNPADGTLIGASIQLVGKFTPASSIDSLAPQSSNVTLTSHAFVFATNGGPTVTINLGNETLPTPNPAGGQENVTGNTKPVGIVVNFTDLSAFENLPLTPQLLVEYGFRTSTSLTGSGVSDLTSFSGEAILTYTTAATTTDVPEPGSMMLLGSGLAGLAWIRRKTKAKLA